ncbi:hypothetical protein AAU61_04250 [Desulfocarbo indianensis]|nr:hypothetical protein AAU61_04250 [Desulfocarbo indianensis]
MLPEEQMEAFHNFARICAASSGLDEPTTTLLFLAAAMALRCPACMERFVNQAREQGLADEVIGAVGAIAMAVAAGSVRNQCLETLAGLEPGR